MARTITLSIIVLFALLVYSPGAFAQKFIAREGLPSALAKVQKAVTDIDGNVIKPGMTNPELFAVGTLSGELPDLPIALEYDVFTGKATVWLYFFRSADSIADRRAIAVGKLYINFFSIEVDLADLGELPIELDAKIDLDKWVIDSDDLAVNLWDNVKFKDYLDVFPGTRLELLGLGVSFENIFFDSGTATWAAVFSHEEAPRLNCYANAETGETFCLSLSSIPDKILGKIEIYPNPASSQLNITLPEEIRSMKYSISIADILGNIQPGWPASYRFSGDGTILVSIDDYAPGIYFLSLAGKSFSLVSRFVISR